MPLHPSPAPSGPGRRTLILGAAGSGAVLLAGCTEEDGAPRPAGDHAAAGERARARAARDSTELVARYDAVIAAHPGLAARLHPLRAETAEHARAFGAPASPPPSSPGKPKASASPGGRTGVPADEKGARTMLADAERSLADRRTTELLKVPGELARLLASVGAAGAAHVYLLTEDGK